MSMDVRFIAFSEKAADEGWKSVTIFNFSSLFSNWEKGKNTDADDMQDELIREDFDMGGVGGGLLEGKYFGYFLEKLLGAFKPGRAVEERLIENYETAPKGMYLALFDLMSEEEIQKRFSNDDDLSSLLILYTDLKNVMIALHDPDRVLYVNVNDELLSSAYFINRAKEHTVIVQELYTQWKKKKPAEAIEEMSDDEGISKNQIPLF